MRVLAALCVVLPSSLVFSADSEFRLDKAYGGRWHDAEKSLSNTEDDLLCWAAAAANVLAWTGWSPDARLKNEDEIFQYYCDHWTDDGDGSPHSAWFWWFTGRDIAPGKGAEVDVPGGGFFRGQAFTADTWSNKPGAVYRGLGSGVIRGHPLILKRVLDQGYGVAIQIVHPVPNGKRKSHVITLWGYRYDENNPFKGILVTDSDDNKRNKDARQAEDALRYYEVTKRDGMWWFTYDKEEWKILAAYALARRPGIQPGDAQGSRVTPPPLSPPTKSPAHAATPSSCPWSTAKRPQH
jgi:hypothetical protein